MKEESLEARLLKSDAYKTLSQELTVHNHFQKRKWLVVNSCFYDDPKEKKIREIDIVATMGVGLKKKHGVTRVHAVAECKSMAGFHVIANDWCDTSNEEQCTISWFGSNKENREFLLHTLIDCDVPSESITYLMSKFDLWFPPYQPRSISHLEFEPYGEWSGCSGFKETNIGSEKDLDNSVIWRASQSLKSATTSFTNMHNEMQRHEFLTTFRAISKNEYPKNHSRLTKYFNEMVNLLDFYHPFIVTDAKLWISNGKGLKETGVLRLYEREIMDEISWWFDVVSYRNIEKYITGLCTHYESLARTKKWKDLCRNGWEGF